MRPAPARRAEMVASTPDDDDEDDDPFAQPVPAAAARAAKQTLVSPRMPIAEASTGVVSLNSFGFFLAKVSSSF